jgi:arsenate reductase-like glutaredoxin family protein
MSELTVYEKPTCTTCRNLFTLLTERGIDFERVNYHVDPLPGNRAVLARPVDRALQLLD